tara:strand:+ start:14032 stop:14904 length:873 start_codon:yes stop_codon:yes gene_type:complete
MNQELSVLDQEDIKKKIHTIRGFQVMLDKDLAELYDVTTFNLNKAVKRNTERFPLDFMFQLTKKEFNGLKFHFGISSWGGRRTLPYAFTEQGVAALSGVLRSSQAILINIQIIRAFVAMRIFLNTNAQIFYKINTIEKKQLRHENQIELILNLIETKHIKPEKGIFFEGQVFDAYNFFADLIKNAKKSIILIDNYIDESVLIYFAKRGENVNVTIYTKLNKQLLLDLKKFNSQYDPIIIKEFNKSHDRFMIIDKKEVYHIGASLKDLGKKWFAFSKFEKDALNLLDKLEK